MKYRLCCFGICLLFTAVAQANDFPTLDRVEYVLTCMHEHGGQSYDNFYACVCKVDQIAAQMPYLEFAEAETFRQLRSTPGEQGGIFRDPPRAEELGDRFEQVTEAAEKHCFLQGG